MSEKLLPPTDATTPLDGRINDMIPRESLLANEVAPEALDQPYHETGLQLTETGAEFSIGDTKYDYLGKIAGGGMVFETVGQDGVTRPVYVYQSRSGGGTRVSQGYETYGGKLRLLKGPELDTNRQQYTQDTQLHPAFDEMVGRIEEAKELRSLPERKIALHDENGAEALMRDFAANTETYPLESAELDNLLHELKAGALSATDVDELVGDDTERYGVDRDTAFNNKIRHLNALLAESGVLPDFSAQPDAMMLTEHPQLGTVVSETFVKVNHGVAYAWEMRHDAHGRAWIERIRFAYAEPSVYGTDKQMVYSGVLTSKPLEYNGQADGLPQVWREPFDGGYNDITPFLKKLLPVDEYSQHYHDRDQYYGSKSEVA